ncbi:MAG: DUF5996 family protein, partial [Bacteroidota bacterium]
GHRTSTSPWVSHCYRPNWHFLAVAVRYPHRPAMLMYDDLLKEENPREALLDFLQSSYAAGAKRAGWSGELTPNK